MTGFVMELYLYTALGPVKTDLKARNYIQRQNAYIENQALKD